ncbi:MAG: DUF4292 domain-containing protein [Bacteroidetes bacterium]|nr:DUF4292 domain-containing protein [Bacteroidota bacterium]
MKRITVFLACSLILFACKTVKKTAGIQEAISKKDTAQTIVVKEIKVDSGAIVRDILQKVVKNKIDYQTFNAKIKVDYESAEKSDNYTFYVSIRKDSVILIKVKGSFLGISSLGLEAKITRDSLILVQLVGDKSVQHRSISYLQEISQVPFDFFTLQDIIMGNPIYIDSNVLSYKASANELLVQMAGDVFKHLLTLNNSDFHILHSKLDDINVQRNRTCDISQNTYEPLGGYQFATYRKITVSEKSKLDIYLDFKEYSLNEPLKYSFEIPKNLKRK